LSARSLADARNRELINTALRSNPLILQAQKTGQLTNDIATSIGLNVSKKATNIVQSTLGKSGLGAKAIAAAQALSEKFGIVTFDVEGNIATVPETRDIDPTIFVGTGRFTDSAFKKSIEVLQGKSDPIASFGASVNETILKPIIKGFTDLFGSRNIADLPLEQQERVKDIDAMLEILKPQIRAVPTCSVTAVQVGYNSIGRPKYREDIDCSDRDSIIAMNAIIQPQIDILEAEREGIFQFYVVLAGFEKKVIDQAEILTRLVKENPLTATLKAEINEEIKIASALLQEIIEKQIQVSNVSMTTLNKAMNAGAARMSEQLSGSANVLEQLGTNLVNNLTGVGGLLDDLGGVIDAITKGITQSFEKMFNPSIEDRIKNESRLIELQSSKYAKFYEDAQKMLAGK